VLLFWPVATVRVLLVQRPSRFFEFAGARFRKTFLLKPLRHVPAAILRGSRINMTRCSDGSRDSIVVLDGFLNDACIVVVESVGDIVAAEIWRNMASSILHV
jgi:hypothetical protein